MWYLEEDPNNLRREDIKSTFLKKKRMINGPRQPLKLEGPNFNQEINKIDKKFKSVYSEIDPLSLTARSNQIQEKQN